MAESRRAHVPYTETRHLSEKSTIARVRLPALKALRGIISRLPWTLVPSHSKPLDAEPMVVARQLFQLLNEYGGPFMGNVQDPSCCAGPWISSPNRDAVASSINHQNTPTS